MNKCKDCMYFSYGGISDQEQMQYGYYAPDGICSKYFPRGYIGRKPPHKKYSNSNACFQFERKEKDEQSEV